MIWVSLTKAQAYKIYYAHKLPTSSVLFRAIFFHSLCSNLNDEVPTTYTLHRSFEVVDNTRRLEYQISNNKR